MTGLTNPVLLVIDSDPISLTATAAVLHCSNYEVHCAQDRQAAVSAAADCELDLILCDLDIGGTAGNEIVDEIHALRDRGDVPVMYASACQLPEVILKSSRGGGVYHLRKPFDPQVLLELVDKALWMPHLVTSHINQPHFKMVRIPAVTPMTHSTPRGS